MGNQLFQWNAGLHLARSAGTPLLVSSASFRRDRLRDFALREVDEALDQTSALENLIIGPPHHRVGTVRQRVGPLKLTVRQNLEGPSTPGQLLVGFFQDEPSLALSTAEVRESLVKKRQGLLSLPLAEFVHGRPVVHIRRGDYATVEAARKTFGSIRPEYYREAFEILNENLMDAAFFTDDPSYVVETFGVSHEQVFGPKSTKNDIESLLLMSLGSSMVIPNSTFSWWAAELLEPERPVISPEEWFRDSRNGHNLARDHWQRLPN